MIKIQNIHKNYGQGNVLEGLSMKVDTGEIRGLLGINGAGKSTLINIIAGLIPFDSGSIEILGKRSNKKNCSILKKVGFVFEEPTYVEKFTALEQLKFTAQLYRLKNYTSRIEELIELFALPKEKKYIEAYSTGMKARISLACALIHDPQILILDEPLSGIDLLMSSKIRAWLQDKKITILISTHQFDLISNFVHSLSIIKKGEIMLTKPIIELEKEAKKQFNETMPLQKWVEQILDL